VAKCDLTGSSRMSGNIVSHSNRKTRTVRKTNVRSKRVYDPESGNFVRINVSTRALRTLSRKGWEAFGKESVRK
jgi:large subunit ribosomal protein L28